MRFFGKWILIHRRWDGRGFEQTHATTFFPTLFRTQQKRSSKNIQYALLLLKVAQPSHVRRLNVHLPEHCDQLAEVMNVLERGVNENVLNSNNHRRHSRPRKIHFSFKLFRRQFCQVGFRFRFNFTRAFLDGIHVTELFGAS